MNGYMSAREASYKYGEYQKVAYISCVSKGVLRT
jgi:hypothetical protein